MRQINCHIPIRVRVTGRPTDEQWRQFGKQMAETIARRIEFADRTIGRGMGAGRMGATDVQQEPIVEGRREDGGGRYRVPSYNAGGATVRLPVRQSHHERVQQETQGALRRIHELLSRGIFD